MLIVLFALSVALDIALAAYSLTLTDEEHLLAYSSLFGIELAAHAR
jgi:hypothetical protein